MKPEERFLRQPKSFWAMVRTISQHLGCTVRGTRQVRVPSPGEVKTALSELDLEHSQVVDENGRPTEIGELLIGYFSHRAEVLNTFVEPRLMDAERARRVFEGLYAELSPTCPIPMNK